MEKNLPFFFIVENVKWPNKQKKSDKEKSRFFFAFFRHYSMSQLKVEGDGSQHKITKEEKERRKHKISIP